MSLLAFAAAGALTGLAALVVAFAWLGLRRRFVARALSQEEAGRLLVSAGRTVPPVGMRYYGDARGTEWTARVDWATLTGLVRERRWREAAPWLLLAGGVLIAFPFWPFLGLQLFGVPGPLAAAAAVVFLAIAVATLRGATT